MVDPGSQVPERALERRVVQEVGERRPAVAEAAELERGELIDPERGECAVTGSTSKAVIVEREFSGFWSARRGDYCVVYEINEEVVTVTIVRVGPRRNVYQGRLKRTPEPSRCEQSVTEFSRRRRRTCRLRSRRRCRRVAGPVPTGP